MTNPVGGFTKLVRPAIAVSLAAYTDGDVIGGAIELPKAMRHAGSSGVLQTLVMTDAAEQDAGLEVFLFDEEPDGTYTDAAAFTLDAADLPKLLGTLTVATASWASFGGAARVKVDGIGLPVKAAKGQTSLWMVLVASGSTPDYAATDDLQAVFGFLQD
ncbi:MAG: hypothetical protein AB7Q29_16005 [Vicinamibacterales bacterium]